MSTPITREQAVQAAKAFQRLRQLDADKLLTENNLTEAKGLREFLNNFFQAHGPGLLACFFAVEDEYEPLIQMFSMLKTRAQSFEQIRARAEAAAKETEVVK